MILLDFIKKRYIFIFFFLLIISCDTNNKIIAPVTGKYVLLEVKRITIGSALDDSCGSVFIDFGGYIFNEKEGILHIFRILDSSFNHDDPFKTIIAIKRTINGDLGSGEAGGVIPLKNFPNTIQVMTFPLAGEDSITISDPFDDGSILVVFGDKNKKIAPQEKWEWTIIYDRVTTQFGPFQIADQWSIINHGYLNEDSINW